MKFTDELTELFNRDLDRLIENLKKIDEDSLWVSPPGITNSCGILAQHLAGNLNHFIGHGLGDTSYERDREREFTTTRRSGNELIRDIEELKATITKVLDNLDEKALDKDFPLEISYDASVRKFLVHLYGHLQYHTGQLNYLRRLLDSNKG